MNKSSLKPSNPSKGLYLLYIFRDWLNLNFIKDNFWDKHASYPTKQLPKFYGGAWAINVGWVCPPASPSRISQQSLQNVLQQSRVQMSARYHQWMGPFYRCGKENRDRTDLGLLFYDYCGAMKLNLWQLLNALLLYLSREGKFILVIRNLYLPKCF